MLTDDPLVIIPARMHSQGIPDKNFRPLPDGSTCIQRAIDIGAQLGRVVVTTDHPTYQPPDGVTLLPRDAHLSQDDTPMSAVIADVLHRIPGAPTQTIILLQPTSPFRTPQTVRHCADSALPCATMRLIPADYWRAQPIWNGLYALPAQRQAASPLAVFTGDCYAFSRAGGFPTWWHPLLLADSFTLDTESDWLALNARITIGDAWRVRWITVSKRLAYAQ
jgi:hypothetical protein